MANTKLTEQIKTLKKEKKAVILAHNYQVPEVQDIADYLGDSLELSRIAAKTDADVIVFCGVHFMAETAYILSPEKTVLIPEIKATCPMAAMITPEDLRKMKKEHPKAAVLGYVNTSANVKAELDVCCTSANAIKVINALESDEVIFVPDKYLAAYAAKFTKKKIIPWHGYCPTHVKILPEHILEQKKIHPNAKVIVHPECIPKTIELADEALSTNGMMKYAKENPAKEFIIGTEVGMLYRLQKENPGKKFYPATEIATCPNMKQTTLEKVFFSLKDMRYEIKVPENIRIKAKKAVDRMLEIV